MAISCYLFLSAKPGAPAPNGPWNNTGWTPSPGTKVAYDNCMWLLWVGLVQHQTSQCPKGPKPSGASQPHLGRTSGDPKGGSCCISQVAASICIIHHEIIMVMGTPQEKASTVPKPSVEQTNFSTVWKFLKIRTHLIFCFGHLSSTTLLYLKRLQDATPRSPVPDTSTTTSAAAPSSPSIPRFTRNGCQKPVLPH